ncbi:hypothetical protein L21SP3_01847 [Sedimentisphaera cyanobacteriorum]|uniref:Ice-binding protein C-terminal domain-containing protein n=1 Tax=Sedimentisphaera cyanobacteriorum TaxID=1940790 RepID=A0A1Q2HS13_9BACT|nr:hypothetical protein [Sedimentisphaera cyanobacteriorum]AQQ10025.1 hypothetical protein L21SP3_01847 [Sedimentisphaera cyanobacteriorum]
MMTKKLFKNCFLIVSFISLSICGRAYGLADVIETFNDYQTGDLRDTSGKGTGFSSEADTWEANTSHYKAREDDLSAPAETGYALEQSGTAQSVQGQSTNQRRQSRRLDHEELVGTSWFSFLVKNTKSTQIAGIDFYDGSYYDSYHVDKAREISLRGTSLYVEGSGGTGESGIDVSSKTSLNENALILGKFMPNGLSESANLQVWVNPDVSNDAAGLGTPDFEQLSDLGWGNMDRLKNLGLLAYDTEGSWGGQIDSLYISNETSAFQDVTGVPEPAALTLLALGGLALRRRQKLRS